MKVLTNLKQYFTFCPNSTSKCSAQNLGSKVTNCRHGSFPRGHDQRSRFQIFSNMYSLDASTLLVVYGIFCYLLFSISIVIGQFSSKWPGPSSRTVTSLKFQIILYIEIYILLAFKWCIRTVVCSNFHSTLKTCYQTFPKSSLKNSKNLLSFCHRSCAQHFCSSFSTVI